jgi:hypothetical protein
MEDIIKNVTIHQNIEGKYIVTIDGQRTYFEDKMEALSFLRENQPAPGPQGYIGNE